MKSYGHGVSPITMDMGGFHIHYREPILGGSRRSFLKESTLTSAMAVFNAMESTSGFDTPVTVERMDVFGNMTHRWNMDGRYGTPRLVGGTHYYHPEADYMAKEGRRQSRYIRRNRSRERRSYA